METNGSKKNEKKIPEPQFPSKEPSDRGIDSGWRFQQNPGFKFIKTEHMI